MMPNDQQAMQYFDYFFMNIHPFVPVLQQTAFYQQWNNNRESISPLLLEAIFAVTTMTLEDHDQGNKWLALASRELTFYPSSSCKTKYFRTRGELQRRPSIEHYSGCPHPSQSSRVCS
jgi:hypothetical protein